MPELFVELEYHRHYNNDGDPYGGAYSNRGTTDAYFESVKVYAKDWSQGWTTNRSRLEIDFEPIPGHVAFVVVVKYSSGDSFGHDEHFKVVAAFENHVRAENLAGVIRTDYAENGKDNFEIEFEGKKIYAGAWKDCFGGLEDVRIETCLINP